MLFAQQSSETIDTAAWITLRVAQMKGKGGLRSK
jgi:hypothetical protein